MKWLRMPVAGFALLWASHASGQVEDGWDVTTAQTYEYSILVDMANDGEQFTEQDHRTLTVTIADGQVEFIRTSAIERSEEHFGPYIFGTDGSMNILRDDPPKDGLKAPPMEAELLLHLFGTPPFDPDKDTWEVIDPPDDQILEDKIELQQRSTFVLTGEHVVKGELWKEFAIESAVRLLDNDALAELIGPVEDRPPEIQEIVKSLGQFNLILLGKTHWNVEGRMTTKLTATYVVIPNSEATAESIATSRFRQHLVAILKG